MGFKRILAIGILTPLFVVVIGILSNNFTDMTTFWLLIALLFVFLGLFAYFRIAYPISFYSTLLKFFPRYVMYYNNRGLAYMRRGKYELARQDFDHAIQLQPAYAPAYHSRGTLYLNTTKNYAQAIQDFDVALGINPSFIFSYVSRGGTYFRMKEYRRAIEDYNLALTQMPNFSLAMLGRSMVYAKLGEYQLAEHDCNTVLKHSPRLLQYATCGDVYTLLRNYAQAISYYDRALTLSIRPAIIYTERGVVSYKAFIYASRSFAYSQVRNYPQGLQDGQEACALAPQFAPAYFGCGLAYLGMNDLQQARANFARSLELEPTSSKYELFLAWVDISLAKPGASINERYQTLAMRGPKLYETAWQQGDFEEALNVLEQAINSRS